MHSLTIIIYNNSFYFEIMNAKRDNLKISIYHGQSNDNFFKCT